MDSILERCRNQIKRVGGGQHAPMTAAYVTLSTIAMIARRIGSGSVSHAETICARSGRFCRRSAKQTAKTGLVQCQVTVEVA